MLKEKKMQHAPWVIFVVNKIQDRPNTIKYHRVVTLSHEFNVILVTGSEVPEVIAGLAQEVHIVTKGIPTWNTGIKIAKRLQLEGKSVYVHTQYSALSCITGYLCKRKTGCKWVYDLWDHPSLEYNFSKWPLSWIKRFLWIIIQYWMLDKADAWIIAMHPAVMKHLPSAPVNCCLIFSQPEWNNILKLETAYNNETEKIKIVYSGPVALERGIDKIMQWAVEYQGPPAELNIIGHCLDTVSKELISISELKCQGNPFISLKIWGELPHSDTVKILRDSNIGLCPLDISILNYRFAYPVKVIEQMSIGLIVVATATHGSRTFVRDNENGILVQNENFKAALDRAIGIWKDSEAREAMCNTAIETVKEYRLHTTGAKQLGRQLKALIKSNRGI